MKNLLLVLLILFSVNGSGQQANDTLNKYNEKKNQQGYWLIYLSDSLCIVDSKANASYYTYIYYDNGFGFDGFFCPRACTNRKGSSKFVASEPKPIKGQPALLNGNFKVYDKSGNLVGNENYERGVPTIIEDIMYDKKGNYISTIKYNWSDKYQHQICSFSMSNYKGEKLKSKYYQAKDKKGEWKMVKVKK